MFGLGMWELLIILAIVLVLFSGRLPGLGSGLGKGISNFRKATKEAKEVDVTPENDKDKIDSDQENKSKV